MTIGTTIHCSKCKRLHASFYKCVAKEEGTMNLNPDDRKLKWVGKMRWRYRLKHAWMALLGYHVG